MKKRNIDEKLLYSYSDDIKNFLKPLYAARKLREEELDVSLRHLLAPDFADLPKALEILTFAILHHQKIVIVGDFDADGATSCALSIIALKSFGHSNVDFLVPNRFKHGYGLSPEIVEIAHQQYTPNVIITVDNGISSIEGVELANKLGITTIITDHHLPGEQLPNANAIINPNLVDCQFGSKNLAGVGVSFYVFSSLKTHLQNRGYFQDKNIPMPDMRNVLDLVALGTIADVVPLDRNNRILVNEGLKIIRSEKCNTGIKALIHIAKKTKETIKASDLGFAIAPRINASGRLEDISVGIKCLLSADYNIAHNYALLLDEFNTNRKQTQESMVLEAEQIIADQDISNDCFAISLYDENWHEGVVGIVAGKLKETYHVPSVIFAKSGDTLKGSARSISHLHIKDVLDSIDKKYPDLILKFGGHAMAAGLSIEQDKFAEFSDVFNQEVKNHLGGVRPELEILTDGELETMHMTLENAQLLDDHIWGSGLEEPLFYGEFNIKEQRIVGEKHLKLRIEKDGLVFNAMAFWTEPLKDKKFNIAYKLSVNDYMNSKSLQLIVEEILKT
jgi:single-stranded-DNA-specific exonuclease